METIIANGIVPRRGNSNEINEANLIHGSSSPVIKRLTNAGHDSFRQKFKFHFRTFHESLNTSNESSRSFLSSFSPFFFLSRLFHYLFSFHCLLRLHFNIQNN